MRTVVRYWGQKTGPMVAYILDNILKSVKDKIILDPFGGTGSIVIEALRRNARIIYIDINPYAYLVTRVHLEGCDKIRLEKLVNKILSRKRLVYLKHNGKIGYVDWDIIYSVKTYNHRCLQVKYFVWEGEKCSAVTTNGEVIKGCKDFERGVPYYWYPKDTKLWYPWNQPFDKRRNYDYLYQFFTNRNLIILTNIYRDIKRISRKYERERNVLLLAFLSILYLSSKMARLGAGSWGINSYWVPYKHIEKNPYNLFQHKIRRIMKACNNAMLIGKEIVYNVNDIQEVIKGKAKAALILGDAYETLKRIPSGLIDYVITDPPHADEIQYLELSHFMNSWIPELLPKNAFEQEIIYNKRQGKDFTTYLSMLKRVYREIHRILKGNGKFILIYHEEDTQRLSKMIGIVGEVGFKIENRIYTRMQEQRKIGAKDEIKGKDVLIIVARKS